MAAEGNTDGNSLTAEIAKNGQTQRGQKNHGCTRIKTDKSADTNGTNSHEFDEFACTWGRG